MEERKTHPLSSIGNTRWWLDVGPGGFSRLGFRIYVRLTSVWSEVKWKSLSRVQLFVTPWTVQSMEFSSQNTGVGSLSLLQGIFPTQGLNPGLPRCRWTLYQLSYKGSPRILEWVAYSFSSLSFWPEIKPGSPALQADSLPTELWSWPNHVISLKPAILTWEWG